MHIVPVCLPALVLTAGSFALAQAGSGNWQKSYPVAGKTSFTLSTGDASIEVRSCGGCREVRVRVEWRDRKPADYTLTEFQSGDHVNFEMKEKPLLGFHLFQVNWHEPHVTVETPPTLDLEARTADGALKVSGVQGNLALHTSDGSVDVEDVGGALRITASDGSIRVHNLTGTLESHSSDGSATIDGRFTALHVHTSDGSVDLTLNEGTQLTAASQIESSDGSVKVRVPRMLAADLEVHTSDGSIGCSLPLTMEDYNSAHNSLRGRLNGGGVPLTIRTSDGSVSLAAL